MAGPEDRGPQVAVSPDGTRIGYWTSGTGPPLVLVHGAPADHTRWAPLLAHVAPHRSVHAVDRRGRGASGDGPAYALEREYEDVAAVVDAVSDATGGPVDVYGHSHGGFVAFGAATRTRNVRRLVLYEGWPVADPTAYEPPDGLEARLDALVAAGVLEGAVEAMFRGYLGMSDEEITAFRSAPSWPARVAAVPTLPRELRAETTARLTDELAAAVRVPVLLVVGEHSTDPAKAHVHEVAAALADARVVELAGRDHVADATDPEGFSATLLAFLDDPS